MDLGKLKKWRITLSYRQKVVGLVLCGVIVGLGALFAYLLRMHTYIIGDDPAACVNCHIMSPWYVTTAMFLTPRWRRNISSKALTA